MKFSVLQDMYLIDTYRYIDMYNLILVLSPVLKKVFY